MASVNINSDIADPFYRYKMPRIIAKVEGKGNGIKTVIVNMPEVAKALSRPPTYTTKFFGCELGAQTQVDLKNDRFIVNGSHDAPKLQQLLDIFIKKFVLCPECHNPETCLTVSQKKQTIGQRCIACGYNGMVDMRHKLTPFILKNPPDMDPAATPTKATKKEKKQLKKKSDKDDDRASPEANAQEQMAAQRASGGVIDAPPEIRNAEEDDEDWGEDFSEDAVRQRMEELSEAAKQMAFTDDLEKTVEERLNMFYHFVKNKINSSEGVNGAMKEIVSEAERLEVNDKATMVLVELLLNNKILQQLKQYKVLFLKFCYENDKAQKYLLGGLEQLVGNVHKDELLPKMPHILKTLYDLDILDEKVIIDWGEKVSKKYVDKKLAQEIHDKSQPFIKWLKEAEEEESDSEEEGGDQTIEVVYSTSGKVGEIKEKKPQENEEEDDFDIDAI